MPGRWVWTEARRGAWKGEGTQEGSALESEWPTLRVAGKEMEKERRAQNRPPEGDVPPVAARPHGAFYSQAWGQQQASGQHGQRM